VSDSTTSAPVIEAAGLHKTFRLYRRPTHRLVEGLTGKPRHSVLHAVDDVGLTLCRGEALGILGRNGVGKSTLLKMLTGVLVPDAGTVRTSGRVTGLLELGIGFDPELSGSANLANNALLLGLSQEETEARRQAIVDFAELNHVIDEPLKTYSSGMQMRLGFAVVAHADPVCLVIDEALSVGDAPFQAKCRRFLRDFRAGGGAILMVSHDLDAMQTFCDRVLVMEHGRVAFDGTPDAAIGFYNRTVAELDASDPTFHLMRAGNGAAEEHPDLPTVAITAAGESQHGTPVFRAGEELAVAVRLSAPANRRIQETVALDLVDRFGQQVFGTSSRLLGTDLTTEAGTSRGLTFRVECRLQPGKYSAVVSLPDTSEAERAQAPFEIAGVRGPVFAGVCSLPAHFEVDPEQGEDAPSEMPRSGTE